MTNLSTFSPIIVLIVEDEPIVRMMAAMEVEGAGFAVLEAESADAAMRILDSRPDVRILFSDIDMPGSMNGIQLAGAVRRRWPPIGIILTSGRMKPPAADVPEGCVFFAKPYAPEHVVATMREFVN
jgi:CheY-like chemotaxis protein